MDEAPKASPAVAAEADVNAAFARLSIGGAMRPVFTILIAVAAVTAADWAMLRYLQPWYSTLLVVALTAMATIAGVAVTVSVGDGVSHHDRRAQDLIGLSLVIAIFGPSLALVTLIWFIF